MKKPELLSPVGDFECLKAAVQNGADSIYLGASSFNARQRANNFDEESLKEAITYAKLRDVNVHLTLNTLIKNSEFEDAVNLAITAFNLGVDAIIIQDLGLATYLMKNYPQIPIHASTQLTIHNLEQVNKLQELGFSRVVLSRELSIGEIENICKNSTVEIETFIHGALCISYSGQCLFSSMVGDRSGNRGLCAQPCRLPYELLNEKKETLNKGYILSPRDVNSTAYLIDLIKAGVCCFKIEGRMKNPEYVAEVTRYYRKYIDIVCNNIEKSNDEILKIINTELSKINSNTNLTDKDELAQVFNRGGFSNGHLSNSENRNLIYKQKPNNMGFYLGKISKINSNKGHLFLELKNDLSIGDRILVSNNSYTISELMKNGNNIKTATTGMFVEIGRMRGDLKINDDVFRIETKALNAVLNQTFENNKELKKVPIFAKVIVKKSLPISLEIFGTPNTKYADLNFKATSEIIPELANNSPITEERIVSQISKTGSTQFEFTDIKLELDDGLFIPKISILNDLRRTALAELEKQLLEKNTFMIKPTAINIFETPKESTNNTQYSLLLNILNKDTDYSKITGIDNIYIPLKYFIDSNYIETLTEFSNKFNLFVYMPTVIRDTKKFDIGSITSKFNIAGAIISNPSQVKFFEGKKLIANYSFNTFNSFTANKLNEFNIEKYTISPELNKAEVINLIDTSSLNSELIVYGKTPLMTNNYCYLGESNKCYKDCKKLCTSNQKFYIKDRLGFEFRILPDPVFNLTTIFNSKITSIKFDDLKINSARIDIVDESIEEINAIIKKIKNKDRFEGKEFTNGKLK